MKFFWAAQSFLIKFDFMIACFSYFFPFSPIFSWQVTVRHHLQSRTPRTPLDLSPCVCVCVCVFLLLSVCIKIIITPLRYNHLSLTSSSAHETRYCLSRISSPIHWLLLHRQRRCRRNRENSENASCSSARPFVLNGRRMMAEKRNAAKIWVASELEKRRISFCKKVRTTREKLKTKEKRQNTTK